MKKRAVTFISAGIILLAMIAISALVIWGVLVKDGERETNRRISIECGSEGDMQYQEEITGIFERHGASVHMRADLWKSVFTVIGSTKNDFEAALIEIKALLTKSKCELIIN